MRSIPVSRMHLHEWPTDVFQSQLLKGLAKKKPLTRFLIDPAPDDCLLATVVIDLHILHTVLIRAESAMTMTTRTLGASYKDRAFNFGLPRAAVLRRYHPAGRCMHGIPK